MRGKLLSLSPSAAHQTDISIGNFDEGSCCLFLFYAHRIISEHCSSSLFSLFLSATVKCSLNPALWGVSPVPSAPLLPVLDALTLLSAHKCALLEVAHLWHLRLTKLLLLPPEPQVIFPPLSFPFLYLQNSCAAQTSLASLSSSLSCLPSALSLPQKCHEAGLLMSCSLINLRCMPLADSSWFHCCLWQR